MLTHAPITVITGEIGAGKTTLLRHLLRSLPEDFTVGLISNAQGNRGELLHWVLMALGVPTDNSATYVQLFAQFQDFLIEEYATGRRAVLIFDEAQNLSIETLEELRMFSNINADKDELIQLVLVGQPELRDLISRPELVQFSQRVAAEYHLPGMSSDQVGAYVNHRLAVAGAAHEIFTPSACEMIQQADTRCPAAGEPDLRLRTGLCLHRRAGRGRHNRDRAGGDRPASARKPQDGGLRRRGRNGDQGRVAARWNG